MKKFLISVAALTCSLLTGSSLFAQGWPMPTTAGGAVQSCPGCPSPARTDFDFNGLPVLKPVISYADPIVNHTGRYADSVFVADEQQPIRTLRAWRAHVVPERNRVYVVLGSTLAAYDLNTFFTRLAGREQMNSGAQRKNGNNDMFLMYDKFFYAEAGGSGWQTLLQDGQERLLQEDWDDRGYLYLAYSVFSWGIVQDDGADDHGLMKSVYQAPLRETGGSALTPSYVFVIKTSAGRYMMCVGDPSHAAMRMFDVTDPRNPVRQGDLPNIFIQHTKSSSTFAGVGRDDHRLYIYSNDSLAAGGAPTILNAPKGGNYFNVDSDGTNIYAVGQTASGTMFINTISRASNGQIVENVMETSRRMQPTTIKYNNGYAAVYGSDFTIGEDVAVIRLSNGKAEEIGLNGFINGYYVAPPSGFVRANRSTIYSSAPVKFGGKLYLIVCAFGLGDVYEIRDADTLSVAKDAGTFGGANGNAPARTAGDVFYGDKVGFTATTGGTAKSVTWNFGNPEATGDANLVPGSTGVSSQHQYSGLTPATLGGARTVTASTTAGVVGTTTVTLKAPVARIGVFNTNLLFTQANASSPAPIVIGDSLIDASDGDATGHYGSWQFTTGTVNAKPYSANTAEYLVPVGDCGVNTLNFTAHYGALSGFSVIGPDYPVTLTPVNGSSAFTFGVRPFAAAITTIPSNGTNLTFNDATRITNVTAARPAALTYLWELLNAAGAPVLSQAGPASFIVPVGQFTSRGMRARLTVTGASPAPSCAPYTSSVATTSEINFPDPIITGDCTAGGPPCSFTAGSASGTNMAADGWSFSWTVSPTDGVVAGTSNASTFTPTFSKVGTYTLTLTAANAFGPSKATKLVNVTVAGTTCETMNAANVFVTYHGLSSGCTASQFSNPCSAGEQIQFTVDSFGYNFTCSPNHSFTWSFDNGAQLTGRDQTQSLSQGSHTASATINNGAQSFTATATVSVGTASNPGGGNPGGGNPNPTPGACGSMTTANVFITFRNASNSCNELHPTCAAGDAMTFSAGAFGYTFTCDSHQFAWTINGVPYSGQTVTTNLPNSASIPVVLTVSNSSQQFTTSTNITVNGGNPGNNGGGSCGTMNSSNVFITYSNPTATCNQNGGVCGANDTITLNASSFGYTFSCNPNTTFSWSIQGQTKTGQTIQHTFGAAGTFPVSLTVNNGSQSFTANANVTVGTGGNNSCPTMNGANVFITFRSANGLCTELNTSGCQSGQTVTLDAGSFGYNFSCGNHTYTWDIGPAHYTTKSAQHIWSGGPQTVRLTVNNGNQNYVVEQVVNVSDGNPVRTDVEVTFIATPMPSVPNTFMFAPTVNVPSAVARYEWDFGDGNKENRPNAQPFVHSFPTAGQYTVTVTAYDSLNRVLKTDTQKVGGVPAKKRGARH